MQRRKWINKWGKRGRWQGDKPKFPSFPPNRQPCAKDCACNACKAFQLAVKRAIPAADWIERQIPKDDVGFARKQALPEHVVIRRRLAVSHGKFK